MTKSRNDLVQSIDDFSLLDLPTEMIDTIVNVGSATDAKQIMGKLSNTGSTFYNFFKPNLDKEAAKQLLEHVLHGEPAKAKAMYTANPNLLFIETSAEDYGAGIDGNGNAVHRVINQSPYQAALGTGDIEILNDMVNYFDQVFDKASGKNGYQIAIDQWNQQFPNGVDYPPSTYDFNSLAYTIRDDPMLRHAYTASPATASLIEKLRKDFIPGVLQNGHHFNLNHLINACEVYLGSGFWISRKSQSTFWRQVIGYLERLVSAVDAQSIPHLCEILDGETSLQRSFEITVDKHEHTSYFPLDTHPLLRLGINFGVQCYEGNAITTVGWLGILQELQKYADQKVVSLKDFGMKLQNYSDRYLPNHKPLI